MITRKVRGCVDCPLNDSRWNMGRLLWFCKAKSLRGRRIPRHINGATDFPKWCPLYKDTILIQAK